MDSQTIFAELRNVFIELYPGEQDTRVVVSDAGLDTLTPLVVITGKPPIRPS